MTARSLGRADAPPAAERTNGHAPSSLLRRAGGGLGIAAVGAGAAFFTYARHVEHRRLRLARRRIAVPGLPAAYDRLRILHLSDLHIGAGHCGAAHVRAAAAALPADLIVLTGDLVHGNSSLTQAGEVLGTLEAPLGVWAVFGNHDYAYPHCHVDNDAIRRMLAGAGVRVLVNEAAPLPPAPRAMPAAKSGDEATAEGTLWLAGVDDPHRRRHDIRAALAAVPPGACTILLAHSPDVLTDLAPGEIALALLGHAHGGQVRLPGLPAIVTRTRVRIREPHGVRRVCGSLVHMHAGLGSPTPLRFGMPPEAALLELVPARPRSESQLPRE